MCYNEEVMKTNELATDWSDAKTKTPEFMRVDTASRLIMEAISGRLEPDGTITPVKVERYKTYDAETGEEWIIGPRIDPLECSAPLVFKKLPTTEERMPNGDIVASYVQAPQMTERLYDAATGRCRIKLDSEAITALLEGGRALVDALENNDYDSGEFDLNQEMPSFQFGTPKKEGDLPPTRLYLQRTDTLGMQVVADLINAGARPDGGKIWVPYGSEVEQRYRHDVVILYFSNFNELEKTIRLLREGFALGKIDRTGAKEEVFSGLEIAGVPGAYVGQTASRGDSFNRNMTNYFEKAIENAILEGGQQPQTGDRITSEWLEDAAQGVVNNLKRIAAQDGRTIHYALVDSSRTDDLLRLANSTR